MNAIRIARLVYWVCFAFLIMACSGTEIIEKQVDNTHTGNPVSNILIIAITGNEHNRKSFESIQLQL